ncbi:MAG: hypothetical protein WD229_04175 [Pirellulales bacterium]
MLRASFLKTFTSYPYDYRVREELQPGQETARGIPGKLAGC